MLKLVQESSSTTTQILPSLLLRECLLEASYHSHPGGEYLSPVAPAFAAIASAGLLLARGRCFTL